MRKGLVAVNELMLAALNNFLSSTIGLWIAFLLPLAVIPMPEFIQRIENILSSNWLQLWALFLLAIFAKREADKAQLRHMEHVTDISKIHEHLGIKEEGKHV